MRIVPMDYSNVDEASRLADSVFSHVRSPKPSESFRATLDPALFQEYNKYNSVSRMIHLVAVDDSGQRIIGTTGLYELLPDQEEAAWLGWFCVLPSERGGGVGARLLSFSISFAELLGKKYLRLYTSAHRKEQEAQALYEKYGFKTVLCSFELSGRSVLFRERILATDAAEMHPEESRKDHRQPKQVRGASPRWKTRCLDRLNRLLPSDQERFYTVLNESGKRSWISFFPFLEAFSKSRRRSLYWERIRDSICLYYLQGEGKRQRLSLYFPPFPFDHDVLMAAMSKVSHYNGSDSGHITWVEEADRKVLEELGFDVNREENEYLYSKESLERYFNRCRVRGDVTIREYTGEDEKACLELLDLWQAEFVQAGGKSTGRYYKRSCIRNALKYPPGTLAGKVLVVNNRIRGACFAGSISQEFVSCFVTLVTLKYKDLKHYLLTSMTKELSGSYWNNSTEDIDHDGPFLHEAVEPHAMHHLYRARKRFKVIW